MWKLIKILVLGFIVLGIVGSIVESNKSPEQRANEMAALKKNEEARIEADREKLRQEISSLPSYVASEIARAYNDNTVAADLKFKNRKFKVAGVVDAINTDLFGKPYLTLRGGVNQFMEPHFSFQNDSTGRLASLKKGDRVNLICTGRGDVAKTAMSDNCLFAQ